MVVSLRRIVWGCAFFLLAAAAVSAAVITPELRAALASGISPVPVVTVLRDQAPLELLSSPDASRSERIRALRDNAEASRAAFVKDYASRGSLLGFWLVNAVAMSIPADEVAALAAREDVVRVELDAVVSLPPVRRGDGAVRGEWTYGLQKLRIPEVRRTFGLLGDGVVVGVIDTGVDASHPDLAGKVVGFKDFVNGKTEPYDDQGHGSHCSGTIAGGNAGGTAIGVAPNARLRVAKAFSSSGSAQSSWLLGAMEYMADPDGNPDTDDAPSIVSNSWGGGPGTTTYLEATKRWLALGIFPCFAAGNSGPSAGSVGTPGGFLEAFAVGATTSSDSIASFSSRGPVTWDGVQHVKPDVSAPGQDVYSVRAGGGYTTMSGTSMACPHVAGLIALIHQAAPGIGVDEVRQLLEGTATELGAPGKDNVFGFGRVDGLAALQMAVSGGKLTGRLLDAATDAPLGGRVAVVENGLTLAADPSTGAFVTTLPEGTYHLVGSAFGYQNGEQVPVTLSAGSELAVDLRLVRSPAGTLAGVVTAASSGAPLAATVRVMDVPVAPVATAADGSFRFALPAGTYRILVTAFGHAALTLEGLVVSAGSETAAPAALADLPPVLVVDDDQGKTYETFYAAALRELGVTFDVVDLKASGGLGDEVLGYETLIWFTGDDYQATLTEADQALLTRYVASGGRLVVSGQDVAYDLKGSAFLRDVVRVEFVKDDAGSRKVSGQGLAFSITGGDGAGNQKYPDSLKPLSGGSAFFGYDEVGGAVAAVLAADGPGATAFLGFGIEGVARAGDRVRVLELVLAAVRPSSLERVARLPLFDREDFRIRWAELTAAEVESLRPDELRSLHARLGGRASSPAVRDLLRALRRRGADGR